MKKLVFGSLNIDRTYQVTGFVRPKETISALDYACFCGGKGFNQAVALARANSASPGDAMTFSVSVRSAS